MDNLTNNSFNIIFLISGCVIFFITGFISRKYIAKIKMKNAEDKSQGIIIQAKVEAERRKREASLEAKDMLLRMKNEFEEEAKERRQELMNTEKRLAARDEHIDKKMAIIEGKEMAAEKLKAEINKERDILAEKKLFLEKLTEEEKTKLENISGLSKDRAREELVKKMEMDARNDAALTIKRIQDEAKETADKEARKIVGLAIQKCCVDHTKDTTVSVVQLPSEEMKGRIIGREGRNIRSLETATGVDIIIDDTPEAVVISGFDKYRREVAKRSLEKLIEDGRIHPARVEEIVNKTKKEMENYMKEEGERALFELGIQGMHPELIKLLGRLKFRTSYGQNVLDHVKEAALLMATMAGELKLDVDLAKRIGLLHDIGKAISHEVEGVHSKIGADLARKYGEHETVIHGIEAHHLDVEPRSLLAVLAQSADAISASRPGARSETVSSYVTRLEDLEKIANSFEGVEKTYAIQAGREIRINVLPEKIDDGKIALLAMDIKKKIESELKYPGQVKIVVVRETRATEFAR